MAGGAIKYRHLSRNSAHRKALLRNLVTSLIEHESISTTWHKAKEAQRVADKLITLGKKNTDASRRSAMGRLFVRGSSPTSNPPEHFQSLTHYPRDPTKSSPNSSAPSANATPTAPAATRASCASSPSKRTRRPPPSSSSSTGPRTCASP